MKIGCLTLAFNQGAYLQSAISSVTSQECLGEYYVYNPGSTDSTSEIIKSNSNLITEIFVESDLGPADGLNSGLAYINSELFYYLNADDMVLPGVFSYVTQYFLDNPDCDVLHGSINVIDSSGAFVKVLPSMEFSLKGYALGYAVVYQQATFIRNRVLKDVRFNIENRISWDGELIVDLAIKGARIHRTRKVLGEFRIYSNSISGSANYKSLAKKQHKMISAKILGRNRTPLEFIFAIFVRTIRAVSRRISPRIEYIN